MTSIKKELIPELGFKCAEYIYSFIDENERSDYLTNKKNLGDLFQEYEGELFDMLEKTE